MAVQKEKRVTVYHPAGFPVSVSEARAEALKERGYKAAKPKPAEKPKDD